MSEQHNQHEEIQDVNKLIAERKHKLAGLRADGFMFPNDFRRDHTSDQLHAEFDGKDNEALTKTKQPTQGVMPK